MNIPWKSLIVSTISVIMVCVGDEYNNPPLMIVFGIIGIFAIMSGLGQVN